MKLITEVVVTGTFPLLLDGRLYGMEPGDLLTVAPSGGTRRPTSRRRRPRTCCGRALCGPRDGRREKTNDLG